MEETKHSTQPASAASKSKRIASNSLLLFGRMLAITVINLYAVRLLLKALGQDDYGTFNAVSGVVLASSFITATLAVSIQRFYSYALGEGKKSKLSDIFSASINIITVLVLVLVIAFETVGLWFVNTGLSIPAEKIVAANWVFQFSLVTLCFSLFQQPFTAAIFAHEEMGLFALISLAECLLRLGVVLLIGIGGIDGLVFYGCGLSVVSVIIFALYAFFALSRYPEYRYHFKGYRTVYKSLLSFSGWTLYSSLAAISVTQGLTILLYMFFGPLATAAFAIALQVQHAFQALGNSVVVAFRPAMVKSYAENNYSFLNKMFTANNKLILYMLAMVALPIALELRTILFWWLHDVPEETVIYTRLVILYMVCLSMHNPITTIVHSTGRVKHYSFFVDSVILMCIPATWLAFRLGAPSPTCLVLLIAICLAAHLVRLVILRHLYPPFRFLPYVQSVVLRGGAVLLCTALLTCTVHCLLSPGITRLIAVFAASCASMLSAVYLLGLSDGERQAIRLFLAARRNRLMPDSSEKDTSND